MNVGPCISVRGAESLTATECAELVRLSRVSVRRHLEHLADSGQATVALRYGSTGRPERRYTWAL